MKILTYNEAKKYIPDNIFSRLTKYAALNDNDVSPHGFHRDDVCEALTYALQYGKDHNGNYYYPDKEIIENGKKRLYGNEVDDANDAKYFNDLILSHNKWYSDYQIIYFMDLANECIKLLDGLDQKEIAPLYQLKMDDETQEVNVKIFRNNLKKAKSNFNKNFSINKHFGRNSKFVYLETGWALVDNGGRMYHKEVNNNIDLIELPLFNSIDGAKKFYSSLPSNERVKYKILTVDIHLDRDTAAKNNVRIYD